MKDCLGHGGTGYIIHFMPKQKHDLIPIVVQESTALIDARLLHQQLDVGRDFSNWIKDRIRDYQFSENSDFFCSPNLASKKKQGGANRVDYLLTLDMAKELAMLERNDAGRHVRRYFIEKEKELRAISHLPPQAELFKGLVPNEINGHGLFPYKTILERAGYSTKSGSSRRRIYPGHFVQVGKTWYVTQAFALQLHHQRQVYNNRKVLKAMAPVLPFDFGAPLPGITAPQA